MKKILKIKFAFLIHKILFFVRALNQYAQNEIMIRQELLSNDLGNFEAEKSKKILDGNVEVGRWTIVGKNSRVYTWTENEKVIIGKFCSIAPEVIIFGGGEHGHRERISNFHFRATISKISPNPDTQTRGIVKIGNDVWIGTRALIMSGVEIGDGSVIGMGAVVNKNIPPYAIVVGNPARIVDYRFKPEIIEKLIKIKWWNWPDTIIKERLSDFYNDIDIFVNKYL